MKSHMNKYLAGITLLFASICSQADTWTEPTTVSYVRTYDGLSYSVGLTGIRCQNSKDYFQVQGKGDNNPFFTIALSSLMSDKNVRVLYDLDPNGTHCFVKAIWIVK